MNEERFVRGEGAPEGTDWGDDPTSDKCVCFHLLLGAIFYFDLELCLPLFIARIH